MRKILTFLFAALMSVGMWADPIVVTWNSGDMPDEGNSFSKYDVTLTCGDYFELDELHGGGTFTSTLGNFTKIEITADGLGTGGSGWVQDQENGQMTWTGNAASVSFGGDIVGVDKIVFTIGPAAPTPVVPEWVREGDEWDDDSKTLTVKSDPGTNAYRNNTEIEHVIISNSVTSIGKSAFYGCSGLTSVTIGNGVTSIGNQAFDHCTGLTSVTIGNSVTSIGNSAFANCSGLTSIEVASGNTTYDSRENCNAIIEKSTNTLIVGCKNTIIPTSVTSIGYMAFSGCSGLTSIEIPNSVTSIGARAFQICSGLTSITIPNSVTSIGDYTFAQCGLTSVTIGNSVESIGEGAFSDCSGLTSIEIPNSVTSIEDVAFSGCSGLTSITIPNSVTSIEDNVFQYCSGLTSITIPNSVTSIGFYAFRNCSGLTSITIPNSVTSIGEGAFYECSNITSVIWNAKNCNGYNFGNQVESFTFGDGVEVIPASLCSGMNKLSSISIPSSVTSIGADAFYGCTNITDVYCYPNAANLTWNEGDCNDFKADGSTLCHVHADQLEAYQEKFTGTVNVTFPYDVTANLADGAYWATFYTEAGNYQAPVGTQVFTVHLDGTTITMTEISDRIVKSGEGVVLKKETTSTDLTTTITMTLTATTLAGDFTGNSLKGTMTSIPNPSYGNIYVLNNDTYGVGFYKLESGKTIDANKAYLTTAAGAREFFLFDEATGIVELKNSRIEELKSDDAWYSLDGRKLDGKPTTKGLYIVNGKKVIK